MDCSGSKCKMNFENWTERSKKYRKITISLLNDLENGFENIGWWVYLTVPVVNEFGRVNHQSKRPDMDYQPLLVMI